MSHQIFNRDLLKIYKLAARKNKIDIRESFIPLTAVPVNLSVKDKDLISKTAERIADARRNGRPVIIAFGAHTIKNGLASLLIELIRNGWATHLATNGAGIIHDWEFAFLGKSGEDVRENVSNGCFGIWEETGFFINLALIIGAYEGLGYGESVGKMISSGGLHIPDHETLIERSKLLEESNPDLVAAAIDLAGATRKFELKPGFLEIHHPFKMYSVQASAFELKIPFTGHPMFGHDIIYNHPANNGAAVGRTALTDFLYFASSIRNIEKGVYISLGSAVMSPMVFEKALSMAQNIAIGEKRHINNHYILVVDLARTEWDWLKDGEPPPDNPAYYLRYCKTFSRMGGEMHYLPADNRDFLIQLYRYLSGKE